MKLTKKCVSTSTKIRISKISRLFKLGKLSDRRRPSAGCSTLLRAGAVTSLILLSILFTSGINGSASAATSTITLSIVDGISVNVLPSGNGTFASSSGTNNISIKTTHATGYTLGIKAGTSGSNALINTNDSSKTIPSITSSISESTYSSSTTYNNTWGFKPSKLNSQANSNYIPGPTDTINSIVLDRTTTANPSTFNDYTITLGTRIDNTQAPGSYANTFIITAIVNPTPYTITYNKNTTDTVTNMPSNVSTETYDETVTISNQVPTREGYNFKGWCTTQTADGGTCTGTTYNPDGGGTNLTWTLDQTVPSNSLTIYAMWEQTLTMQTAKFSDCGKTMPDSRDGQRYTTALIDGQCWMTTNLNLAGGTTLTPEQSNVSSNYTLPNSSSAGFSDNSTPYVYNSGSTTCGDNSPCYSYYSYVAATAGTNPSSGNARGDICPKGWKLPSKSDFESLTSTYNTGAKLTASPFLAVYGGFFSDSTYYSRLGSDLLGAYWSSTADSGSNGYYLYYTNSIAAIIADGKHYGGSVRCVKDLYMQDVDQWKDKLTIVGEQVKAIDNRDGKEYWVSKQADGNIWMTQNLDLDIGGANTATLTSENTDLNESGSGIYTDGYSTSGGVITWAPDATANTSGRTISGTTVSGWTNDYIEPYSAEGGDRYYYTTGTTSDETAQTLAECTSAGHTEEECVHYHAGNYYNWTAAIASNASSGIGSTGYVNAGNSICPKGWKLPSGRASSDTNATRQFGYLFQSTGITSSLTTTSYATNGFNKVRTSPLFFVRGGGVYGNSLLTGGNYGYYWSSTVGSASSAYNAAFGSSDIYSASTGDGYRYYGLSIRCMAR